jgi:hypothetical protein
MMLRTPRVSDTHATLPPAGAAVNSEGNENESACSMVNGGCCPAAGSASAKGSSESDIGSRARWRVASASETFFPE